MGKNNQLIVQALMPPRLGIRQLDLKQLEIQSWLPCLYPIKSCSTDWLLIANNMGYQLP